MIKIEQVKEKDNCLMVQIAEEHPMRPTVVYHSWVCIPKGFAHEIWNYFRQFSGE